MHLALWSSELLRSLWVQEPAFDWALLSPAPATLHVSAVGEGTQLVLLKGVDRAGNSQLVATNYTWFVPLSCSASVAGLHQGGGSRTSNTNNSSSSSGPVLYTRNLTLFFALNGSQWVDRFLVSIDGGPALPAPGFQFLASLHPGRVDGDHNIRVWGVDATGAADNETCASVSWVVDTTAPVRSLLGLSRHSCPLFFRRFLFVSPR